MSLIWCKLPLYVIHEFVYGRVRRLYQNLGKMPTLGRYVRLGALSFIKSRRTHLSLDDKNFSLSVE